MHRQNAAEKAIQMLKNPLNCNPVWSQQMIPNASLGPTVATNRNDPQHAKRHKCQTMGLSLYILTRSAQLQKNSTCTPGLSHHDTQQMRNNNI